MPIRRAQWDKGGAARSARALRLELVDRLLAITAPSGRIKKLMLKARQDLQSHGTQTAADARGMTPKRKVVPPSPQTIHKTCSVHALRPT